MSLTPGARLGPYEITALLGEGGMGKVWRAHHTALKRDDALKVLPDAFASDPDRLARFRREAQVLASLNHPNIAHVYGLEQSDGVQALVMELVEGPTLADRISQGPIPVDEALPIAKQIAEALEAAHEQGIIHRDLKPSNIKLRPDGTVKVLDFGLAKALEPTSARTDATASPTITSPAMTQRGVILGTAAYMSPEQARGKAVDTRSDVWAFGCVLYEMLTGHRPFSGDDVTDTLANVLKLPPDWKRMPASVPPRVRTAIHACLQKDRKQRIGDIQSVRLILEGALDGITATSAEPIHPVGTRSSWRLRVAALTAAIIFVAGVVGWTLWPRVPTARVTRFADVIPQPLVGSLRSLMALSADGRQMVYPTADGLYMRRFDELEPRLIPGTDGAVNPVFSPDGQSVAYFVPGEMRRIAVTGGTPTVICSTTGALFGARWEDDNTIVFGQAEGIMRVSANGGTPELVAAAKEGEQLSTPRLLPDGEWVMYTVATGASNTRWDSADIVAQSLRTGERKVLVKGGSNPEYVPSGHLLYAVGAALFAVAFNVDRLEVVGGPVSVAQGLSRSGNQGVSAGTGNFGVSEGGTLVYVSGPPLLPLDQRGLVWVTRDGREIMVPVPPRFYTHPRISPDGSKAALDVRDQQLDIWVWDFNRQTLTRLTFDDGEDEFGIWSVDGKRIAFSSTRGGGASFETTLYWVAADGTGPVEGLTQKIERQIFPSFFSPDGSNVVVFGSGPDNNDDISVVPLKGESAARQPQPLLHTAFGERVPSLSPDGRWMAYESNESGQFEIYVRPFPNVDGGRWQVSSGGGIQPVWARNGRELFFRSGEAVVAVPIQSGASFAAGNPQTLFKDPYMRAPGGRAYDVSADGQRFLMVKAAPAAASPEPRPVLRIVVIQNWTEELKRLVPVD